MRGTIPAQTDDVLSVDELRLLLLRLREHAQPSDERTPLTDKMAPEPGVLEEISREVKRIVGRRFAQSVHDFVLNDGAEVSLPLPLYHPATSPRDFLSGLNFIAGLVLSLASVISSFTTVLDPLAFVVQLYLSIFGVAIMILEAAWFPGHGETLRMVETWCKFLIRPLGKGMFYAFVAALSLSFWRRSSLNMFAGSALLVATSIRGIKVLVAD